MTNPLLSMTLDSEDGLYFRLTPQACPKSRGAEEVRAIVSCSVLCGKRLQQFQESGWDCAAEVFSLKALTAPLMTRSTGARSVGLECQQAHAVVRNKVDAVHREVPTS